jgi:hypothetical protein
MPDDLNPQQGGPAPAQPQHGQNPNALEAQNAQNKAPGSDQGKPDPNKPDKHPDLNRPPAGPGENRVQPIWVAPDDWHRQQNELRNLREFRAEQDKIAERAEAERIKLLTDKGQIEEAYNALRGRYEKQLVEQTTRAERIEKQWLGEKSQAVISEALAGKRFAGVNPKATADMVRQLLGQEIEAVIGPEGTPVIRDRKTLRPAMDYLLERLDSPDLGLFFEAQNRGGAGTDGARPAAPNGKHGDPNEAFAATYLAQREAARNARFK